MILPAALSKKTLDKILGIKLKYKGCRGVAQLGRALRSGRRGRRFESSRPDQESGAIRFRLFSLSV